MTLGSWALDPGTGYLYNGLHRYYFDVNTGKPECCRHQRHLQHLIPYPVAASRVAGIPGAITAGRRVVVLQVPGLG